jgi:hypothetical protein
MSRYAGLDGAAVELEQPSGAADARTLCAVTADVAIVAKVGTLRGEVSATLYIGAEQVQLEISDPATWGRLAAAAVDGERLHRAALTALHVQDPEPGQVVTLAVAECKGDPR